MSGDAEQDYFADGISEDIKEEAGSDARAHR
jgi:TolB-like protein